MRWRFRRLPWWYRTFRAFGWGRAAAARKAWGICIVGTPQKAFAPCYWNRRKKEKQP